MTMLQQLDQSPLSQGPVLPYGFPLFNSAFNFGMLANKSIQVRSVNGADTDNYLRDLPRLAIPELPALRLGLLKRQKFTPQGREQRIARSLAALNAQQPTVLTLEQWKALIEEVEDED